MEMFAKRISALDPFLQHDGLGSLDKEAFIMQRRGVRGGGQLLHQITPHIKKVQLIQT